jgi:endo-1,4-beta-D-glucanase Y
MKLLKSARLWLLVLPVLALPACGERLWPPQELFRVLTASWKSYRQQFISPEGRVVIPERGGGTISEAQAYGLLRAVWAGDEATFGQVYTWTHKNLSRPDHLLSWLWGRRADGSWGVLDANTASDGDLDYALALVLAARRGWRPPPGLPAYLAEAKEVMSSILTKEVAALPGGTLVLTPGDWHETGPPYLLNPSYFSPGAYRLFAQNGAGPVGTVLEPPVWDRLHQSTYEMLDRLNQGMAGNPGVGLFPDWCRVDAAGRLSPAPGRETQFGWEAVRLPWRLCLDLWFGEPRGGQILKQKFLPFFKQEWQARGKLVAVYKLDGSPAVDYESPVLYAGVLAAALTVGDQDFAGLLSQKIMTFYQEKDGLAYFVSPDNYYANNWAWLGLALYAGWVRP